MIEPFAPVALTGAGEGSSIRLRKLSQRWRENMSSKLKRFLSLLLAFTMVLSIVPVSAEGSGGTVTETDTPEYVAQIEGTGRYYTTLQAAFEAAQDGDTIKLLGDVVDADPVKLSVSDTEVKTITLDLDGYTWDCGYGTRINAVNLTVKNGTIGSDRRNKETFDGEVDVFHFGGHAKLPSKMVVENVTLYAELHVNNMAPSDEELGLLQSTSRSTSRTFNATEVILESKQYDVVTVQKGAYLTVNGGLFKGGINEEEGAFVTDNRKGETTDSGETVDIEGAKLVTIMAREEYGYTRTERGVTITFVDPTPVAIRSYMEFTVGANYTKINVQKLVNGEWETVIPGDTSTSTYQHTFEEPGSVTFRVDWDNNGTYDRLVVLVKAPVVAQIGDQYFETLEDAFAAAEDGDEVDILVPGTYALSTSGKNITITGAVDGVVFDNIGAKNMGGANVTFNNVTFDYYPNVHYTGLQHSGDLEYINCTFNGQVFLYGTNETFIGCTFNQNSADAYNVWTYGASAVDFRSCTFNCVGKSVLLYTESANAQTNLTVVDCDFIASAPVEGKAAIEIDTHFMVNTMSKVTIDAATTATGFGTGNVSGNSLWNDKAEQTNIEVWVDGEQVWPIFVAQVGENKYTSLKDAIEVCTNGETVMLLTDITYGADDAVYAHGGATGFGNYDQYNPSIIYIGGTRVDGVNSPSNVNAVIDLNGHTITNEADAYTFLIMDNARLTFTDNVGGGKVENKAEAPVIWSTGTDTVVTIDAGQYVTANDEGLMWATHSGDLVINGGTFKTTASDASLLIVRNEQDRGNAAYFIDGKSTVTVNGGTFYGFNPEKMYDDSTDPFTEFNAVGLGFAATPNETETVWIVGEWNGEIWTKEDLEYFRDLVDAGMTFEGKTVTLMADINLENDLFDPIGSYRKNLAFKGTFDGNGKTISNLSQNTWELDNGYYYGDCGLGLFGLVRDATIKNLTINGANISGESAICGTVAACAYGDCTFENITIQNAKVADYQYYAGGIVGWASGNHEYIGCNVQASTTIAAQWGDFDNSTGGVIGGCGSSATILMKDCRVACRIDSYNDVTSSYQWYAYRRSGMLIGNTGKTEDVDGTTYAVAPQLTCENVTVLYGSWADYHYCEFAGTSWPYVRVEAGVSNSAYSNPRYGHPTDANGNAVVDDDHVHNDGEDHMILCRFDQLYGGGQGVYGQDSHAGVAVYQSVAEIERTGNVYETLDAALAAAEENDTIILLREVGEHTVAQIVTIDNNNRRNTNIIAGEGYKVEQSEENDQLYIFSEIDPIVTITFTDSNSGETVTLKYPSERYDTIQKLIGTNDYADFVLGAEQSELLAHVANGTASNIVMTLHDDVALDAPINFYNKYFQVPVEYAITLDGNGHTITWADGYTGTLLNVESGVSLTTKNLTIDGENAFTFYNDTTTVEDGQNWYTRFVDVGEEDKAVNANVIVNAGNLTLNRVAIKNVTIASDSGNGKTENTETGYVLKYNDDLAIIKSNGGSVVITNQTTIRGNAGLVLNAIETNTQISGNSLIDKNMGCGNKGGIIIANGGTMNINGNSGINANKAMARSATILGVINGAKVTFGGLVDWGGDELYPDGTSMIYNKQIGVGGNTAGAMVVLEGASQFVLNGGTISNNVGGRAGAIASRWATADALIELNAGVIKGNTASNDSWNGASIFLRSPATIGEGMTINGIIAVNAAPGELAITGGNFTDTVNNGLIVTDGLTAEITGGTFSYDPTEWLADGYVAPTNDEGLYVVTELIAEIVFQAFGGAETRITYPGYADSLQGLVDYYMFCNNANETALPGFSAGDYTPVLNIYGQLNESAVFGGASTDGAYVSAEPMTWTINTNGEFDPANIETAPGYVLTMVDEDTYTVTFDYVRWVQSELLAGNDVTLDRDIVVDGSYIESIPAATNGNGRYPNYGIFNVVGENVTFDLNGHNITYNGHATFTWNDKTVNSCTVAHGLFFANAGANLEICDSVGDSLVTVYGVASGVYSASPNSVINVTGGSWVNKPCQESGCGAINLFLYASHGGKVVISAGNFSQTLDAEGNSYLIVNHNGEYKNSVIDYAQSDITIYGGTFTGMNPEEAHFFKQTADNKLEMGETYNAVAKGYKAVDNGDGTYTVQPHIIARLHLTDPATGEAPFVPYLEGNDLAALIANGKAFYAGYYEMTLELLDDIELDEGVTIDYPMTINLSGKNITSAGDVFIVTSGANVTINGEGAVAAGTSDDGTANAIWADGGNVTINGGTYSVGGDSNVSDATHQNDVIYTKNGGTVSITGGTFLNDGSVWTLNENDANRGTITVTGGTFHNWNPEDNVSEGPETNFCAQNYFAEEVSENTFAVKDYVRWIKAELLAGNDVTLECDIVVDGSYVDSIPAYTNTNGLFYNPGIFNVVGDVDVVFDLNGHKITYNGHADAPYVTTKVEKTVNSCTIAHGLFFANADAHLEIRDTVGNATVTVNGTASAVYAASPKSSIDVTGGSWINKPCQESGCGATNLFLYASHGGKVIISAGNFSQTLDAEGNSYLIVNHNGEYKNDVIDFAQSDITIYGGTFTGMNPEEAHFFQQTADNKLVMGETYNAVAKGYKATDNGNNSWTVEPNMIFEMHLVDANGEAHWLSPMRSNDLNSIIESSKVWYESLQGTYSFTLKVLEDYEVDETVLATFPMTIDLCGNTLTAAETLSSTPVIRVLSNVTVKNGTVDGTAGESSYAFIVGNSETAGTLNIADGTYKGDTSAISITNGNVNISGGTFEATEYEGAHEFTLNCIDSAYNNGTAKYNITGGMFYMFNPENNAAEGVNTNFLTEQYTAVQNGDYYEVMDYVAWLQAELLAGNDVTLDRDIVITDYRYVHAHRWPSNGNGKYDERHGNGAIFHVIKPGVELDLNGHNITWDAHGDAYCNKRQVSLFMVTITGNAGETSSLTIKNSDVGDNKGKIDVYGMGTGVYVVGVDAKATITGGVWTNYPCKTCGASNIFMYPSHGGEMYITGGAFRQVGSEYLVGAFGTTGATGSNDVGVDYGETKLAISGGTFTGFNPETQTKFFDYSNGGAESNVNGCADGYIARETSENVWEVVRGEWIAQIIDADGNVTGKYETLAAAIAAVQNGETIVLLAETLDENVTIKQKSGLSFTIDGDNKTYTGTITIDGSKRSTGAETLTIQNVNFVADTYGQHSITTVKSSLVHNVTVDNCTFNATGDAVEATYGIYLRHAYNIKVTNVTGENLFDLVYGNTAVTGFTAENVNVANSTNGIVLAYVNSTATFKNVTTDVTADGVIIRNNAKGTVIFEECSIDNVTYWKANDTVALTMTFNDASNNLEISDTGSEMLTIVLNNEDVTVTAPEGLNATTPVEGKTVIYEEGMYKVVELKYVAQIDETKYTSLQAAINAAVDNDEIILLENLNVADEKIQTLGGKYNTLYTVAGKTVTINLNSKTISGAYAGDSMLVGVFSTEDGGHLTLTGNGTVDVTATGTVYSLLVAYDATSSLTIENGTYTLDKASDNLVYTGGDENVTVNGGTFTLGNVGTGSNGSPWIFNAKGQNTANVIVNGGTYNAEINHQYYPFEVAMPATKALRNNNDGTWTVVDAVAYVNEYEKSGNWYLNEMGYATLAEAVASAHKYVANAAAAGVVSTITLLADSDVNFDVTSNIGLELNGKAYTGSVALKNVDATLKAVEGLNVTTDVEDGTVIYEDGVYKVIVKFCFAAANVNVGNDLDMKFAFKKSHRADWTGYYVHIVREYPDGTTHEMDVPFADWGTSGSSYYMVTYGKMAAKEMADQITLVVCDANGNEVSYPWVDSMRDYAMRFYDSAKNDLGRTLAVDMLNYGAAAQVLFDYNVGDLANNQLTAEQQAYASELEPIADTLDHGEKWKASNFESKSNLVVKVAFRELTTDMYAIVEYDGYDGTSKSDRIEDDDFTTQSKFFILEINGVKYTEARSVLNITIYNADGTVYTTSQESIEAMAARANTDVYLKLMRFCDSARTYLLNK